MADVIIIQDEKAKYAENLFSYKSTLNDNDINVNIVSGGSSAVVDVAITISNRYLQVTRVHKAV